MLQALDKGRARVGRANINTFMWICTYIHMYMCMCIYLCIYAYIHTYMVLSIPVEVPSEYQPTGCRPLSHPQKSVLVRASILLAAYHAAIKLLEGFRIRSPYYIRYDTIRYYAILYYTILYCTVTILHTKIYTLLSY